MTKQTVMKISVQMNGINMEMGAGNEEESEEKGNEVVRV